MLEEFLEEWDIPDTPSKDFAEAYLKAKSMEERIRLLQEHYGLEHLKIEGEVLRRRLVGTNQGRAKKTEEGYEITIIGNDEDGYITLHEFLHIWLEETGRTVPIEHEDDEVNDYLFYLRNFVNDYLLETEVKRVFGNTYSDRVESDRGKEIKNGLLYADVDEETVKIFMYGFASRAISTLYPGMEGRILGKAFGKGGFNWDKLDIAIEHISWKDSSISQLGYEELVVTMNRILTGTDLRFREGKPVIDEIDGIKETIEWYKDGFRDFRERLGDFK